jgi:hypothetical protein
MINATAPNDNINTVNDRQKLLARAIKLLDTMPKKTVITNHQLEEFVSKNFTLHQSEHRYFLTRTVGNPDVITFVWHRGFYYAFAGDAFKLHCLLGYNVSFDEGVLTVCLLDQEYQFCKELAQQQHFVVRFYN